MKTLKSILFFLMVFMISLRSYSQLDSLEHKFFNNDSIHYDIIYVSHSVLSKESSYISRHYVRIRMPQNYKKYLLGKDTVFWSEHLRDENSDWATNLILYYLFDRDASTMIIYDKRKKWLNVKKNEIEYWEKFLSTPH